MIVTYLYHSGFLLEFDHCYVLFDYIKGALPTLVALKPLYVFVSHHHEDHYSEAIFQIKHEAGMYYVLSDDIVIDKVHDVTLIHSNQHVTIQQIDVQTLASTDEGVAFCLGVEGKQIFYAGDFHWWDWGIEDSALEAEQMEATYRAQLECIKGKMFDVAFLVADPRLQERYAKGARLFLQYAGAMHLFLMHMWDHYEIQTSFIKDMGYDLKAKLHMIESEGQIISISQDTLDEVTIQPLEKTEAASAITFAWEVFQQFKAFEYSQAGIDEFYQTIHDEKWLCTLRIYGAFSNHKLIGMIAIGDQGNHISLFFIKKEYHGKGIGRLLLQSIQCENTSGFISVNSSPYAVPIYQKLGFIESANEQVVNGIRFIPMQMELAKI